MTLSRVAQRPRPARPARRETSVVREVLAALAMSGADVIPLDSIRDSDAAARLIRAVAARAADRRGPGAVVWRCNTGATKIEGSEGRRARFVRYGLPGQADIQGVIRPWGTALQIEVKTDRVGSRQSPAQEAVEALIDTMGGVYFVARSGAEARTLYLEALAELERRFGAGGEEDR